jgi:hypothetical protein
MESSRVCISLTKSKSIHPEHHTTHTKSEMKTREWHPRLLIKARIVSLSRASDSKSTSTSPSKAAHQHTRLILNQTPARDVPSRIMSPIWQILGPNIAEDHQKTVGTRNQGWHCPSISVDEIHWHQNPKYLRDDAGHTRSMRPSCQREGGWMTCRRFLRRWGVLCLERKYAS